MQPNSTGPSFKRIDDYLISLKEKIGKGSYGNVYRGYYVSQAFAQPQPADITILAIKEYRLPSQTDPDEMN